MLAGAIWFYLGSDEVLASEDTGGRCTGNLFENNYINGATYGVYMSEADGNMFLNNTFVDTDENEWVDNEELLWKVSAGNGCASARQMFEFFERTL